MLSVCCLIGEGRKGYVRIWVYRLIVKLSVLSLGIIL